MTEIERVLVERGGTHGSFKDNAAIAVLLRETWRSSPNWLVLSRVQQLALDEIALKIARILSAGAPVDLIEPWLDVSGYAQLVVKSLEEVQNQLRRATARG